MCALHPASRAQVNIDVNMGAGTSAKSSTIAAQNSTFVSSDPVRAALAQLGQRGLLQRLGDLVPRGVELARRTAQHPGARVLGAVDAVAEAHQALALVEQLLDVPRGVAGCSIASIMCSTRDGAPPCSGPDIAPTRTGQRRRRRPRRSTRSRAR